MKNILWISLVILTLASCQKVIDVDLNDESSEIVLDASYSAKDSTVSVLISLTSSYFNSSPSEKITDAVVSITDQVGTSTVVPHIGNGQYTLTNFIPQYGVAYTLTVSANGKLYTAKSTLNTAVQLDPMTYEFIPGLFGSDGGYVVYLKFQDPVAEGDYYEIVLTRNGSELKKITEVFTQDDVLTNGNFIERPLFGPEFFDLGDTIGMELKTITKARYEYVNQLQSVVQQNSGAPGNPKSNWDNNALGFFSCYSSSFDEVIIE